MNELSLIYEPDSNIQHIYGYEPGKEIFDFINNFAAVVGCDADTSKYIHIKVESYAKKMLMMHKAFETAVLTEIKFVGTQNRDMVTLIWNDEIEMLYHTEATILFGRSALDIIAYLLAIFTLEPFEFRRNDSFNSYSKKLLQTTTESNREIREYLADLENNELEWYRVLCGKDKGRSERDKIVHKSTSKIQYLETRAGSDKEYCHYIIGEYALPFEEFLKSLTHGVFDFIRIAEKTITANYISYPDI